jgi:hypothetical protein
LWVVMIVRFWKECKAMTAMIGRERSCVKFGLWEQCLGFYSDDTQLDDMRKNTLAKLRSAATAPGWLSRDQSDKSYRYSAKQSVLNYVESGLEVRAPRIAGLRECCMRGWNTFAFALSRPVYFCRYAVSIYHCVSLR